MEAVNDIHEKMMLNSFKLMVHFSAESRYDRYSYVCVCAAPISFQNDICLGLYTGQDSGHDIDR